MPVLDVAPLSPALGCEVQIDLGRALTREAGDELRRLYREFHLILVRGQHLTMEEQTAVMAEIGPVIRDLDGQTYISNVREDGALGSAELAWHSDLLYAPFPNLGLSLHAVDVVDGVTSTRFANAERALTLLPADLRRRVETMEAFSISAGRNMAGRASTVDLPDDWPARPHPVVAVNPQTGVPVLHVSYNQTAHIVGLSAEESEGLLEELFGYLYRADNVYEHFWRLGDLLIWDNYALHHARGDISTHGNRSLQRVVVGEKSLYEQFPALLGRYYDNKTTRT